MPTAYRDERAFDPFRSAGPVTLMAGRLFWALPHSLRRKIVARVRRDDFRRAQKFRASESDAGYSLRSYDEHHCIFVHVPKVAGVSVATGLFGNLGGGHLHIGQYELIFTKREFDSYFKFTFVRNPWDRLLSAYEFLRTSDTESDRAWSQAHLSRFRSFEDFVLGWVNERSVLSEIHFVPQYRFVCAPFSRRMLVDFVGRYERLERDFTFVSRRLSLSDAVLSHLNRTPSKADTDYRELYTKEMRRVVERVYQSDVELFEYSFDHSL